MAKVIDNIVTEGLSGKLGKRLVFRKGKAGTTHITRRFRFQTGKGQRKINPAEKGE